jgi:type IV secretion system protein VirD4
MVDKQRDSVKMTVTKALTPWLRTSIRDRGLPVFDPLSLDDAAITLYVLSPSDGTVAPLAVTLMEQLIRRQRVKVAQWEEFPRIGMMFLDELPNTPLPNPAVLRRGPWPGCVDLRCGAVEFTARRRLRRAARARHP